MYKFESKTNPDMCVYIKGAFISTDGEVWRIPEPKELQLLQDLENTNELIVTEIENDETLPTFADYSNLVLLTPKEACEKVGFDYSEDDKNIHISCKCGNPIKAIIKDGVTISIYCDKCKKGIIDALYAHILFDTIDPDILQINLQDPAVWITVDEEGYNLFKEKINQ